MRARLRGQGGDWSASGGSATDIGKRRDEVPEADITSDTFCSRGGLGQKPYATSHTMEVPTHQAVRQQYF